MNGPAPELNFHFRVPEGDSRERLVCRDCGFVHYVNPKIVVGAVCRHGDRVLLCRRSIDPRRGFWTIPAGFLEEGESVEEGARREIYEEARARVSLDALLAVYSVPHISQVLLVYLATLSEPAFAPGEESLEVALFRPDEVPWDALAFPSVAWALRHARAAEGRAVFAPFSTPSAAP